MIHRTIKAPEGDMGDIVISMSTGVSSYKKVLISPRCLIFFKTGKTYQQIGLVQKMGIQADCNEVPIKMEFTFPKQTGQKSTKKALDRYKKMCSKFNIAIKSE